MMIVDTEKGIIFTKKKIIIKTKVQAMIIEEDGDGILVYNTQSISKTKPSAEGQSNYALHDSDSKPSSKSCRACGSNNISYSDTKYACNTCGHEGKTS